MRSNALFDLFTFNKYTVDFFKRHFGIEGVEKLIVNSDKPDLVALPTRENSLSYRHKLQTYGFQGEKQDFSTPHVVPPLSDIGFKTDDLAARKVAVVQTTPAQELWKLYFTCNIFGSRSIKI